jgi:hypothetical protein
MAAVNVTRAERIVMEPDPYEQFRIALGYRVGNPVFISGQQIDDLGKVAHIGQVDVHLDDLFHGRAGSV